MIRELKTLLAVAREGTFAAAGASIGLTQAAVSAQMRRLETDLGIVLFDRVGRAARLNEAGLRTVQQTQALLRLYAGLGSSTAGLPTVQQLSVGAIASVQRALLPDALARFLQAMPHCRTRVVPGLSMELINLVDAGEIEFAAVIRPPFLLRSDLHWTTLVNEPFRLLVPAGMPGDDWSGLLASQPFIRYDRASFGGRQVDRFLHERHIDVREICELDELEAIVQLVANGTGIALAPQTASHRQWPQGVRAIDLGKHAFDREIGLVHRANRSLSAPARLLAQQLLRQATPPAAGEPK